MYFNNIWKNPAFIKRDMTKRKMKQLPIRFGAFLIEWRRRCLKKKNSNRMIHHNHNKKCLKKCLITIVFIDSYLKKEMLLSLECRLKNFNQLY